MYKPLDNFPISGPEFVEAEDDNHGTDDEGEDEGEDGGDGGGDGDGTLPPADPVGDPAGDAGLEDGEAGLEGHHGVVTASSVQVSRPREVRELRVSSSEAADQPLLTLLLSPPFPSPLPLRPSRGGTSDRELNMHLTR